MFRKKGSAYLVWMCYFILIEMSEQDEMQGLLIQYIPLADHHDPYLDEFTYGVVNSMANRLKRILNRGDFVFFHTSIGKQRVITAYYVIDRVLDAEAAISIDAIVRKYKNPHLHRTPNEEGDLVLFGDPILSKKLDRPMPFTKSLAKKLSLGIPFDPDRTVNENISSATRTPRELTKEDIKAFLDEISKYEKRGIDPDRLLTTDEVLEIREKDLENLLAHYPQLIGEKYRLVDRQLDTREGRLDLLLRDEHDELVIAELKLNEIGRSSINQIKSYMQQVRRDTGEEVRGIIICKGIMPTFEDELGSLRNISIFKYGWKLGILPVEVSS